MNPMALDTQDSRSHVYNFELACDSRPKTVSDAVLVHMKHSKVQRGRIVVDHSEDGA